MKRLLPLIVICLMTVMWSLGVEAQTFISTGSGDWDQGSTWNQGGATPGSSNNVIILPNHEVAFSGVEQCNDLQVDALGSIVGGTTLIVNGDMIINGDLSGIGTVLTNKTNGTIDGSGSITISNLFLISDSHTISTTADLTVNGNMQINDPLFGGGTPILTHEGTLTVTGNIVGGFGVETFFNNINAVLNVGGSLMSVGFLNASGTDNLINYATTNPITIKAPDVGNYQNVEFSGGSTYTLPSALTIDGNLTITSGTFNTGDFNLTLNGDFTNNGTFNPGTSTITFGGAASQLVTLGAATSVQTLVLNNSGGGITVDNNIAVSNQLTMTDGNIDMSGNTLTLGVDAMNEGTLSFTSGRIIGSFERWIGSTGGFTFPIGVAANDRTVELDIVALGAGGSVIASFIESSPGNAGMPFNDGVDITNAFPDGYWDLSTPNTFATTNYNLDLTGAGFSNPPGVDAATRLIIRADAGSNWVAEGTHEDAVGGTTAQRNGLTNFPRQYAFGDDTPCTPPVTMGINGSTDVCTGTTEDYSIDTPTVGSTYGWTITGGTVFGTNPVSNTISGEDLDMISVVWDGTGQIGNVTVVETNICSGNPVSLDVTVNSIAPTTITGETNVAENTTGYTYSVTGTANYSYAWTITGGTVAGTNPVSNTISGLDLNEIQVDWGATGIGNVSVVAQRTGCDPAPAFDIDVTIFGTIVPDQNGDWNVAATWVNDVLPGPTDNVRITNGFIVSTTGPTTINNLIIDAGQTLNVDDNFTVDGDLQVEGTMNVAADLTANGDIVIDGQLNITGANNDLNMNGGATAPVNTLGGTGTISIADGFISIQMEDKEIPTGTQLTLSSGGIDIGNNRTVTNNGDVSINGNLDGGNSTSAWINGPGSTLTLNADIFPTNGSLSASATGNTVEYIGSGTNNIIIPADAYYNLQINGTLGNKVVTGNLNIDGNFNLFNGTFDANNVAGLNIMVGGDWTHLTGATFLFDGSIVTFDGDIDQTIAIPGGGTEIFDNLVINKPGGSLILDSSPNSTSIQIGSGTGSGSTLTFTNGVMRTTTSEPLTVLRNASMNDGNASSYVVGPLIKRGADPETFPVGDGNIWAPVTVSATNGANRGDAVTVRYFDAAFSDTESLGVGLNNVSTVEYWDIDVNAGGSYTADLTFFWKDQDRSAITEETDLRIARFNSVSGMWEQILQSAINFGAQGDITISGVTNFSPFTFGSGSDAVNPLPVELLTFEARLIENQARLTWATASEVNNDFFEVQRSEDGTEWEIVGEVDGNGTINEVINYDFTDPRPLFGKSFYRLRQVDFDGQFEYSPVVSVNNLFTGEAMEVLVFPNPTDAGNINLRVLTGNRENKISLQLIDALGHRFIDESMNPEVFSQDLIISPRESLSKGVYFLIVTQNNQAVRQRLIIN